MTNEAPEAHDESRISRRNALKAGVGVGVGAVAWTGPKITAFGATPAYAQQCTFAIQFELSPDRNTDQSSGCTHWRYHELRVPDAFRSQFTLDPELTGDPGVCSDAVDNPFEICAVEDLNLDCYVRVLIYNAGAGKETVYDETNGPFGSGTNLCTTFVLPDGDDAVGYKPSARYSITVSCVTPGKEECF